MKALSGKELINIVKRHGWELKKITGSHHIYSKMGSKVRLSIPVNGNKSLKIGLQKHLLKMAGLPESEIFNH